ncbi:MAG: alpha/beta hydrolase [Ruminococcaceae bacterium]|nr:alpha/beta hydrolase [Oscillospiraceae bacterium]
MLVYIILISIAALAVISFTVLSIIAIRSLRKIVRRPKKPAPEVFEQAYRLNYISEETQKILRAAFDRFESYTTTETSIISHDGLKLIGHIIEPDTSTPKGTVIFMHGYRSSCRQNLCMPISFLLDEGYRVLYIYQRAHGKSEGKYITFGVLESLDAKAWCEHVRNLFGESSPIALFGASMGGTSVMCSTEKGLPENVRAIICDGGYTSPWEVRLYKFRKTHSISPYPFMNVLNLYARLIAKFSLKGVFSPRAVASSNLPFLLIYGTADKAVPYEMGVTISEASERTKLISVEGAHHLCCCMQEPTRYKNEVISFLEKNMK